MRSDHVTINLSTAPVFDSSPSPTVRVRSWLWANSTHRYSVAAHAEIEIAYVDSGTVGYDIGSRSLDIEAGSMLRLAAGVEHRTRVEPGTQAISLWIDPKRVSAVAGATRTSDTNPVLHLGQAGPVEGLLRTLLSETRTGGKGLAFLADALVEATLTVILRREERPKKASTQVDDRLVRAQQYVQDNYTSDISVDDLARAAGVSRFHFSRLFRAQLGMSPYRFVLETRISRAAELLGTGGISVTEAAFAVGFADLGRFGRAFRRKYGVSPSTWLKNHAA